MNSQPLLQKGASNEVVTEVFLLILLLEIVFVFFFFFFFFFLRKNVLTPQLPPIYVLTSKLSKVIK
jgi:hypothetical protein